MTDQWAPSAVTTPVYPALPPAEPYPTEPHPSSPYPPVIEHQDARQQRRRRPPRWIIGAAIAVIVAAGAGVGGWALRGTQSGSPAPPPVSQIAEATGQALSPDQAKQKICGSYQALALQWISSYGRWKDALPQPWSWDDPQVKAATAEFDNGSYQVATQLAQLAEPNAPADLIDAVRNVRGAITDVASSHLHPTTPVVTNSLITAVSRAMGVADRSCGFTAR